MEISFHHANPVAGNESFLMRFDTGEGGSPCLLVDAGHGVDLDALLGPDDRLAAIFLTHAHIDHYADLASAHRDGAPIFTAPATADVLGDVFDVAATQYDVASPAAVTDAITPIDGWTDVTPAVDVTPVPAGHVPGAAGYLIRVDDGDRCHRLLVTGDFTRRRVGGFPGFDPTGCVDIDALFLTAATDDGFEAALTEALGTVVEHAHGGARTLLATSGLVGVQCAYLLAALGAELDLPVPVTVVGQVAKLYEALGYDCPGVEAVPVFQHTDACLAPGTIAIAGPEIPIEQSSARLFGVLREDPSACVVQLVGSGNDPITDARCTVHAYELTNHPTRETLVEVHDAIDPLQTIVTHSHGGAQGAFNDLDSVVWASGDRHEYTLFHDGRWQLPPWMHGRWHASADRHAEAFAGTDLVDSVSVPSLDRHADVDLAAEGVVVEQIATRLHRGPLVAGGRADPTPSEQTYDDADKSGTQASTMSEQSTSTTSGEEGEARRATGLVDTVDPGIGDEVDPDVRAVLEENGLTPDEIQAQLAAVQEAAAQDAVENEDEADDGGAESEVEDGVEDDVADREDASQPEEGTDVRTETSAGSVSEDHAENGRDDAAPDHDDMDEQADAEAPTPSHGEARPDDAASTPAVTANGSGNGAMDGATTDRDEAGEGLSDGAPVDDEGASMASDLHPIAVALAMREADRTDGASTSVDDVIVEAVDAYIVALLAGEASGGEDARVSLDVSGSPAAERALQDLVRGDDRFDSTSAIASAGLYALYIEGPMESVELSQHHRAQLRAIVENDRYVFDTYGAVVEAAVGWFVADSSA